MRLALILCIVLAQLCNSCSFAMPVEKRQAGTGLHDYLLTMLRLRRQFKAENCREPFNGQMISPHICETNIIKFFLPTETETAEAMEDNKCSINFTIITNDLGNEVIVGADLVLYKLPEIDAEENVTYTVHIAQELSQDITTKEVSATSSGWQIFSIDIVAVQWPQGESNFRVTITAEKDDGTILPCSAVSSLFVTNPRSEFAGSGELAVNTEPPEHLADFVPIVTVYAQGCIFICFPSQRCNSGCSEPRDNNLQVRQKRDGQHCSDYHDYVRSIFRWRRLYRHTDCKRATFNGLRVNPLHCSREASVKFFCGIDQTVESKTQHFACDAHFRFHLEEGETATGSDLSLYKLSDESQAENITYSVHIVQRVTTTFFNLLTTKTISSSATGWHTFHTNMLFSQWREGTNNLYLKILVWKHDGLTKSVLSCSEISSLFVLQNIESAMSGSGTLQTDHVFSTLPRMNSVPVLSVFYKGPPITLPPLIGKRTADGIIPSSWELLRMNELESKNSQSNDAKWSPVS